MSGSREGISSEDFIICLRTDKKRFVIYSYTSDGSCWKRISSITTSSSQTQFALQRTLGALCSPMAYPLVLVGDRLPGAWFAIPSELLRSILLCFLCCSLRDIST